ncbi:MAG: hypothetical protein E7448_02510 [Ruminococcaceae bacterium]|nr:hypothetical protein [Oscillospiraceae bacterium]
MVDLLERSRNMKRSMKRILPILLVLAILFSIGWYLLVYDRGFTQDILMGSARFFEKNGQHAIAAWFYDQAYRQSNNDAQVAIELAEQFKKEGNFTKAEYTLSNAIADGGSVELYIALCKTYVEQDKLLDAVRMLDKVADPKIKEQLDALRPGIPTPNPAPGYYSQYISVSIECPTGTLYTTTDSQYPSIHDDPYTQSIQLVGGENTIYALAVGDNGLVSELAVLGYVVGGVIEDITLTDPAIDSAVRQLLNKGADVVLSSVDLWTITSLTMPAEAVDYTDLQYLPYLESLTIDKGNFANLNGLASLSYLRKLTISNCVLTSADLAVIASLPNLRELTLDNCSLSSLTNLSAAQNLTFLNLNNNVIRDLSVIATMSKLEALSLSHNALTDLSQLSVLTNLKELDVSYNSLTSIAPLASCTNLWAIDISYNKIASLDGIESLKNLSVLKADNNDLTDISLLAANTLLTKLDLSHNALTSIAPLSALNSLETLLFDYNEITQLPQWDKNCSLIIIQGSHNQISSIEPLSGLRNLNYVVLEYNSLTNVDALANCHNLIQVNIFGNKVKDVSKLTDQSIIVNYSPV